MSPDVVKVSPLEIQWKVSSELSRHTVAALARIPSLPRFPLDQTDKHKSIAQRYLLGAEWETTPLFVNIYTQRLSAGDTIRGCRTWPELVAHYNTTVDAMYADLRDHGYRREIDGRPTPPIPVYLDHDDELVIGNQGNHRLAMAQILALDHVIVDIVGRHPTSTRRVFTPVPPMPSLDPELPECARAIPAMTTDAERRCYYRLTRQQAAQGAIVELGAWLGASTAYIAAGLRDAGAPHRAQVYDRFVWNPKQHDKKAGGRVESQLEAFNANLGPLLEHVDAHAVELKRLEWTGGDVALLVCDAPKRIPQIAMTLQAFGPSLKPGALMAWQDFAYFPSYDIPAAMIRLGHRVEFVEAVYPGTTAVFRVRAQWSARDVTESALAINRWAPDEVEAAWDAWAARLPEPMRPRFACGAAMFLCDLGAVDRAQKRLKAIIAAHPDEVLPKWRYLVEERSGLMDRYRPLVEVLP